MLVTILYASLFMSALILIVIYKKLLKENTERIGYLVLIATATVDFGYLLLSCAKSIKVALIANRLTYLSSIMLLTGIFTVVTKFCNFKIYKFFRYIINFISLFVMLLALSGGSSIKLYYESVDIEIIDNVTKLVKTYGPLHNLYGLYVLLLFVITLYITIYSIIKKKVHSSVDPVILLLLAANNLCVWHFEKIIPIDFELLSVSYIITGAILILLFKNDYDYIKINSEVRTSEPTKTVEQVIEEWKQQYKLTKRETEIIQCLTKNTPRAKIAEDFGLTEHTIKKHTAHIYEKIHIKSRTDLLHKINEEIMQSKD